MTPAAIDNRRGRTNWEDNTRMKEPITAPKGSTNPDSNVIVKIFLLPIPAA
jgi:hypothetical protein